MSTLNFLCSKQIPDAMALRASHALRRPSFLSPLVSSRPSSVRTGKFPVGCSGIGSREARKVLAISLLFLVLSCLVLSFFFSSSFFCNVAGVTRKGQRRAFVHLGISLSGLVCLVKAKILPFLVWHCGYLLITMLGFLGYFGRRIWLLNQS